MAFSTRSGRAILQNRKLDSLEDPQGGGSSRESNSRPRAVFTEPDADGKDDAAPHDDLQDGGHQR